jgi:phospholipase C
MTSLSNRISTVVLVVMENRSFDHMLGHLTYEGLIPEVNGLEQNLAKYQNFYQGGVFTPFLAHDHKLGSDVPHEFDYVATQLADSVVTGDFAMTGFVEAYARFTKTHPAPQPDPMAFFGSQTVPITSFLAQQFAVCDRWHSSLPTSTQPNRTMAFCGSSHIFNTSSGPRVISTDEVLFDWLGKNNVRWRVYHDGLSFFALYTSAWKYLFTDHFRDFERYFHDMQTEPADGGPELIIVEPSYNDAPHIGPDHPNDNHPPLAIGWGEDFLRRTYQAATINPIRWSKTLMIHYYDEHGGFYDHIPPPRIQYETQGNPPHQFSSLGVRVPGILISPWVRPGFVCHDLFDHTSVLQLLAERFTPGRPFSAEVDQRRRQGIGSLSLVLQDQPQTEVPEVPAQPIPVATDVGAAVRLSPANDLQASFELAVRRLCDQPGFGEKYPDLHNWLAAVDARRAAAKS